MPLVSIGIPVFNGDAFIRDSIESILSQTFTDLELIISDNGSTDRTAEICLGYADKDRRVRFHRNERNIGATKNFRRVFELARGKYFKWQCYDDMCSSNFLSETLARLESDKSLVLAYPFTVLIREDGRQVLSHDCWRMLLNQERAWNRFAFRLKHFRGPTTAIYGLIRTEVLAKTRLIDAFSHSDQVLIMELALQGRFDIAPRATHFYRHHRKQSLKANRLPRERMLWFDTAYRGTPPDEHLKLYREMFVSVWRAPVEQGEKLLCSALLLRPFLRRYLEMATGGQLGRARKFRDTRGVPPALAAK
jgi:glycosyltransferase involved in cell wall biosynthesis